MSETGQPPYLASCLVSAAIGGIAAVLLCLTFGEKCEVKQLRLDVKAMDETRTLDIKSDAISKVVGAKAADKIERTRTVTKEIVRYVPQILPGSGYVIRNGVVRVHDAAALGDSSSLGGSAGAVDDAASSPFTDAELATVVAENYGTCYVWREQLIGLQGWVLDQQKLLNTDLTIRKH